MPKWKIQNPWRSGIDAKLVALSTQIAEVHRSLATRLTALLDALARVEVKLDLLLAQSAQLQALVDKAQSTSAALSESAQALAAATAANRPK